MPVQGLHPRTRSVSGDSDALSPLRGVAKLQLPIPIGGQRSISQESGSLRILGAVQVDESQYGPLVPDANGELVPDENGLIESSGLPRGARKARDYPSHGDGDGEDLTLPEVLNFNSSIYDLTIQYSCNVAYRHGDFTGICNLGMVLVLQALNVYLQMNVLIQVDRLIAKPAMAHAQHLYEHFTEKCYGYEDHYVYGPDVEKKFLDWGDNEKGELCAFPLTTPSFFSAILLIWTFFLMCEMKQTAYLSWHLLKLPRPEKGHVLLSEIGEHFIISEAGMGLKSWITLTVLLPKFAIAVVLWYIGARWLTATTGIDNLVLNSLALTFICELDELIFQTCVPEATKSCLDKVKLPLPPIEYSPTIWGPIEMIVTLVVCGSLTMLYVYRLQDVIPDYRFDLEKVCRDVQAVLGTHFMD